MRFSYRLDRDATSWDFLIWLVVIKMAAEWAKDDRLEVHFSGNIVERLKLDRMSRSLEQREAIYQHVMRPALRLVNATETDQFGDVASYHLRVVTAESRAGRSVPKYTIPQDYADRVSDYLQGRKPVVITLREADYYPQRNSNLSAWTTWAAESGEDVVFVRDTAKADEPIDGFETCPRASRDVLFRAALMAAAKANMMINNGPAVLSFFGGRPFAYFKPLVTAELPTYRPGQIDWWRKKIGLDYGEQFPWCQSDQIIVWDTDSVDAIRRGWTAINK